jgi:hypothetical protein
MVGPNLSGYVSVGILGGMAFEPYFNSDNTLLSELNHITAQEPTVQRLRLLALVQRQLVLVPVGHWILLGMMLFRVVFQEKVLNFGSLADAHRYAVEFDLNNLNLTLVLLNMVNVSERHGQNLR